VKLEEEMVGFGMHVDEISQHLEITPPFLMIDYVKEVIPGKSAIGVKKLTSDDWFFDCHLKRELAMPGTLQIEAMLQTLVLTIYTIEGHRGKLSFVSKICTRLFSKVSPGDPLFIHANLNSFRRGIAEGVAVGEINEKRVCEGEFTLISPHELPRPHGSRPSGNPQL
jgi:3-hydroxyacyl-[acyl-carrier-protein] dehydratase